MSAAPSGERPAGLALVFAAMVYDGLLTLAIAFLATALALVFTGGEAIPSGSPAYRAWLVLACFPYFGWCWSRGGGHTLGMRAWRLRLRREDGGPVTPRDAVLRYLGALVSWAVLGLGFLWLLGPRRRSWHDLVSGTYVTRVARRAEPPRGDAR